jgi:hypothetical protein
MTERDDHPASSHFAFPYFFADSGVEDPPTYRVDGIHFFDYVEVEVTIITNVEDLLIFYDNLMNPNYTTSWCTKWDSQDYTVTIGTWLTQEQVSSIQENVRPGAVGELFQVLGKPFYYDKSWSGKNTLRIVPNVDSESNLKNMRKEIVIYPKNVTTSPIPGSHEGMIEIKIEGYVSGSSL